PESELLQALSVPIDFPNIYAGRARNYTNEDNRPVVSTDLWHECRLFLVGKNGRLIASFRLQKIDAAGRISQYFAILGPGCIPASVHRNMQVDQLIGSHNSS